MAQIYRAPEDTPKWKYIPSIFLAGSIDMGKAEEWQLEIEEALKDEKVIIYNPRRLDFDSTAEYSERNPYMNTQIIWELRHLDKAHIIIFYFDPNGKAPITLYELGRVSKAVSERKKFGIVLCPKGYWKRANVIINSQYDGFIIVDSKEELIEKSKKLINLVDKLKIEAE
jgi:hypothetical protein